MTPEAKKRGDKLFIEALGRPMSDRAAFLRETVGDDPELLAYIQALLSRADEDDSFLETPASERTLLTDLVGSADESQPDQIGAFRIIREIGRGGLGIVYLAERVEGGFEQRVALKLIRPGMATGELIRRFEIERRVLASLQHPNIAQLVDGGLTSDGQPYFAMEYIDGVPITEYCRSKHLDIRARLQLFRSACVAVQYAHTNLVVHRDLKPSNILVHEGTGDANVKLLDFGIAKILASDDINDDATQTGFRAFTPGYASPEQMRGLQPNVTSDVYSLGIVLYELITGRKPFDSSGKSPAEFELEVLNTDPARPTTVVKPADTPDHGAISRLPATLRRDLDSVVLKAIRKEPDRRYSSVGMLAGDIDNFLASRPVSAQPDSWRYRANRFVRRNRVGVALGSLFGLALLAAVAGTSWQARVAARERDGKALEAERAEATLGFVLDVFESVNPSEAEGAPITARRIVDAASERLRGLDDQPLTYARMTAAVGELSQSLGLFDVADSLWSLSLAHRKELLPPDDPEIAQSLLGKSSAISNSKPTEAIALVEEAIGILTSRYGATDLRTLHARNLLAGDYYRNGENERARAAYEAVLSALPGNAQALELRASAMTGMGAVLNALLKPDEAEPYLAQATILSTDLRGERDPETLRIRYAWAESLRKQDRLEEALKIHLELLPLVEAVHGKTSDRAGNSLMSIGFILNKLGRYEDALPYFDSAQVAYATAYGAGHGFTAIPIAARGESLFGAGRVDDAIIALEKAIAIYSSAWGATYTRSLEAEITLARAMLQKGRVKEAERLAQHALDSIANRPHRTDIADNAREVLEQIRTR